MKGIVFTEFLEMLEARRSPELVDAVLDGADLPSGGAYTSVGTYEAAEMVALVTETSERTGTSSAEILQDFGRHLLHRFTQLFPVFFEGVSSSLEFLPLVETYIHLEVQKLYPDAQLPTFEWESPEPGHLTFVYRSSRNLPDLAQGLIEGAVAHFGDALALERHEHPTDPSATVFRLRPTGP